MWGGSQMRRGSGALLWLVLSVSTAPGCNAQVLSGETEPVTCLYGTNLTFFGDLTTPQCNNFTRVPGFNPHCLPAGLRNYTLLSGIGVVKEPQVYNTWMFAETCGLRMTAWRAMKQLPRRTVIFKAAEAVLQNWGVYFAGTILGVLTMNIFYVSKRGSRCWGCFRRDGACWHITYQKVVALIEILFLIPIALMVLVGCVIQFFQLSSEMHAEVDNLMTPVCYPGGIQDSVPMPTCKDIMRLDWVCNADMMKVLLLGVFAMMDIAFSVFIVLGTWTCCVLPGIFRIACCCCGCPIWKAACNRPDCLCGHNFSCGICMSWVFCHTAAKLVCYFIWIPIVLALYFLVGMCGSLIAFSVIFCFFACFVWLLTYCCKLCCEIGSFGTCFTLPIPSYLDHYVPVLYFRPSTLIGNFSFHHDDDFEQARMMGEMYGEQQRERPDWDDDAPSYESRIMGTPCPPVTMLSFPMCILIATIPIVLILTIAGGSFLYQDYLTATLAWAESDMTWYYTPERMGPGMKMWTYCWQIFTQLFMGLTDALQHVFEAWWWFVKNAVTFNSVFYSQVASFFQHGVNPVNLFQTEYFYKFRQGVMFWRFLLAFFFAVARSIPMVNMPFEKFNDFLDIDSEGIQRLKDWY